MCASLRLHNTRTRSCKLESCNGMQHVKVQSAGERQAPHKRYRNICLGKWKLPINLLQPLACCCGAMSVRSQAYMFMHTHSCKCACVNVCMRMLASACMRLHAPARMFICKFFVGPAGVRCKVVSFVSALQKCVLKKTKNYIKAIPRNDDCGKNCAGRNLRC